MHFLSDASSYIPEYHFYHFFHAKEFSELPPVKKQESFPIIIVYQST